jgi:hypothetical protein
MNRNSAAASLPASVQEMSGLKITGNIIPQIWFSSILLETGKPDLQSILILSDITYWFRPSEIRDEKSGNFIGFKKKFTEDMLRRSYADLEIQFGLSTKQCQRALQRLEDLGVIKRVFRSLKTTMGIVRNVMCIDLKVDVLRTLTFPRNSSTSMPDSNVHTYGQICPASNDGKSDQSEASSLKSYDSLSYMGETVASNDDKSSISPMVDSDVHTYGQIFPASRPKLSRPYKEANNTTNNSLSLSSKSCLDFESIDAESEVLEREFEK